MSTKKPPPPPQQPAGLIGLYGHVYTGRKDEQTIRYRFQIVRKLDSDSAHPGTRYLVQYFSFVDGTPSHIGIYGEYELLGPRVRLYLTEAIWNAACEQDSAPQDVAEDFGDEASRCKNPVASRPAISPSRSTGSARSPSAAALGSRRSRRTTARQGAPRRPRRATKTSEMQMTCENHP